MEKEKHPRVASSAAKVEVSCSPMSLHEHEEAQPLTAEDQHFFNAVKAEFGERCTDDLAIRVARAYRGVKKNREQFTIAETKRILDARAAYDVDNVLKHDLPLSKLYIEYWPTYLYGEDKEGHLVTVDRISDINHDGLFKTFSNVNDIIPHRWQYMERIQWEKVAISRRRGHRVYKHVCIVDLKGLSMKLLSPSVLSHLKKDMKAFLEVAQNHGIPLSSLPSYMGGSHPGRVMNNTFTASQPNTPYPVPAAATTETTENTEKAIPAEGTVGLEVCAGN
ncbi:unnamed protein product [Phytophthora fragariaefolia]|uniref:Unnamed protein product n=1 Tax=Phytophthora fragariaefolia TaxID=1490495 RepID=A0A9W6XWU2_9STRA|nr:unnamed protein product [Phytophthora fragariaefolia]